MKYVRWFHKSPLSLLCLLHSLGIYSKSRLKYICLLFSLHSRVSPAEEIWYISLDYELFLDWSCLASLLRFIFIVVYFLWSVMAINLTWDLPISSLKNFPIFLVLILIKLLIFITILQIDKKSRPESKNNKK